MENYLKKILLKEMIRTLTILKLDVKMLKLKLINLFKIKTLTRLTLERKLFKILAKTELGSVLDIGSGFAPYEKNIQVQNYTTLDIKKEVRPDILCDVHNIKSRKKFNTVLATELLEHCYDPQKAVDEMYRVLNTRGTCILSTRFIFGLHGTDYYRFTDQALRHLFKKFKKVTVYPLGNKYSAIWDLTTLSIPLFKPLMIVNSSLIKLIKDSTFNSNGYLVVAIK
jgi:SAM-dependent methyltransferase